MAYTTFSTDNADYVLQLGNHVRKNRQVDIFEGIDGLVLETGENKLPDLSDYEYPQYDVVLKYCAENHVPVFSTDADVTFSGYLRDRLTGPITNLLRLGPVIYYGFSEKMANELILNCCATWEFLNQQPMIEGRNAINARKIEEFVAPFMAERLERRPYLGIIFGAGHMGLKPDLQSKRRRDFTLWNWRNCNFGRWAGFVQEDLDLVQEANHDGKEWKTLIYTAKLFD